MVVRRDGETGLQGLRAALALALGDRPPALFLLGDAVALLESPAGSEAAECVRALAGELRVPLRIEGRDGDPAALLREVAALPLAQVF